VSTRMGPTTAWDVIWWGLLATILVRTLAFAGAFFLSAWLTMIFWGIVATRIGLPSAGYDTALIATVGLWLAISPMAWLVASRVKKGNVIDF
jgi:hypothetical protein